MSQPMLFCFVKSYLLPKVNMHHLKERYLLFIYHDCFFKGCRVEISPSLNSGFFTFPGGALKVSKGLEVGGCGGGDPNLVGLK